MHKNSRARIAACLGLLAAFSVMLSENNASATTIISDDFGDGTLDNTIWSLPGLGVNSGQLAEANGRLEFTADVTPFFGGAPLAHASLQTVTTAPQDRDWSFSIDLFIDDISAISGFGGGNFLSGALETRPSGPDSINNGEDEVSLTFGWVDGAAVGQNSIVSFLTQVELSNGNPNSGFSFFDSHPTTGVIRFILFYDADTTALSAFADIDANGSVLALVDEADTSLWGMDASESFTFQLEMNGADLDQDPSDHTNFTVDSGDVYFDNLEFVIADANEDLEEPEVAPFVPEPASFALLACLLSCFAVRRR